MEALPIDNQSLLRDVEKLSVTELEQLVKDLNALLRRKKAEDKTLRDSELLHKINSTVLTTEQIKRLRLLRKKMKLGTLTDDDEHEEFDNLGDEEYKLHNQRLKYIKELAKLRAVSLSQVMESLGLHY